ncbi:MAG: molybdenum cofactor biosynthesis protein MoaE [Alcanivoracaceae bacterium]
MTIALNTGIQALPLDLQTASEWLHDSAGGCGAVVLFSGQVRNDGGKLAALVLEHYPGMSERMLAELADRVASRWSLARVLAWHRVGVMATGEIIVLVGVAAAHRGDAFEAATCLMDLVKTQVPLWKKVRDGDGEHWVDARDSDLQAAARWRLEQRSE